MRSIERSTSQLAVALIALSIGFLGGCQAETEADTQIGSKSDEPVEEQIPVLDSLSGTWSYDIRYTFNQGLLFDSISESEYQKLVGLRTGEGPVPDSSGLEFYDDSLVISTALSRLVYPASLNSKEPAQHDSLVNYSTYHGRLSSIPTYVVSTWHSGSILTGSMIVIDSLTNTGYFTGSVSDGATDEVILSPGNRYLAFYSNSYHESGLGILSHSPDSLPRCQELVSFRIKGIIEEIFWTEDERLVMRMNHKERGKNWRDQIYYLASASLRYRRADFLNSEGDSLKLSRLHSIFQEPFIFPDPDSVASASIRSVSREDFIRAQEMPLLEKDSVMRYIQLASNQLLLRTADSLYALPHQLRPGSSRWYSYYKGYFLDLKLHEVYLVDGTNAVAQTLLIDSVTSRILRPVSPFDAGLSGIQFSADGQWMMAISNSVYNPEAYLGIYRVYRDAKGLQLKQIIDKEIDGWNIEKFKWMEPGKVLLEVSPDAFGTEKRENNLSWLVVSFNLN